MSQPKPQSETVSEKEKLAWLRLSRTENVGPVTFYKLIESCGSAIEALDALPELSKRGGRKKPLSAPVAAKIEREYEALQKLGGDIITAAEDTYPLALAACDDAPPVISVLGNTALINKPCIGMVGARNASINGRKFAENLARELGRQGQVIASGMARGIDTSAHIGALDTGTIAVVAGGIDVVYPEENQKLYDQMKEHGLIIAESPLGQKPFAQSFPRRNRIVSGLSAGIIVVEATMRSGSLITARLAGEQGRDVYAVPGHPMDPRAAGPNHLLRQGATLIRSAQDVLEGLNDFSGNTLREPNPVNDSFFTPLEPAENIPSDAHDIILSHLSFSAIAIDELIRACHLSIPVVQTILLELELAGRVKRMPGNKVSLLQEG